jgi:site-specific recombinase XerD
MTELSNIVAFPQMDTSVWIDGYQQDYLTQKGEATMDAYVRILRQFTAWVAKLQGHGRQFVPSQLTTTAVERYLSAIKEQGHSVSHRTRVKTVINGFCQ